MERALTKFSGVIKEVTADFKKIYDPAKAIQPGTRFPDFQLSDATGKKVLLDDLLTKGAVLISFYPGEWCPFCNLELRAFQSRLEDFESKGVTLVVVSPDVDDILAKQLGILFPQPEAMRTVFNKFSLEWNQRYGNDNLEVPVPATFLVDKMGIVRNSFVDPEYQYRLEPETALQWIDAL